MADRETRIAEALADLHNQDRRNITATAKRYGLAPETLSKRFRGITNSHKTAISYGKKQLTDTQEETLITYVNKLNDRGFPPTPAILRSIAESILHGKLGKNWCARFRKRYHKRLASIYLKTIDHKRKIADNSRYFQDFFDRLKEKIEKFDINVKNIYNVDEKGFLIGFSRTKKRVVSLEALKSKRVAGASHDGNREFITLIASICADGSTLPPALIYQGESHDLQDTWLDDFDTSAHRAFFACSKNRWSDDAIGLEWLKQIFDRSTKEKITSRDRRLLIVDGHSSHVNMPFIDYADASRIVLAVFPPHSTHRLQPLDIGLFSPLATYYSNAMDRLLSESQGLVRLTKRDFWSMFYEAWRKAFHAANVRSAWEAAGLYPLNPSRVIVSVARQATPPEEQPEQLQGYKTPGSTRSLRRTFRRLQNEGKVDADALVLLHAGEKLAAERDIARHENIGLRKAVIHEKKKRKRGKAMHLYDEGETEGQGRFFSPAKIDRIRERMRVAEEEQRQHQLATQDKKAQRAIAKAEKAAEVVQRKEERQLARQIAREQLAAEKTERQATREAQKAKKAAEAMQRKQDVEEHRAQRLRLAERRKSVVQGKKRVLEETEENQPRKRPRTETSRTRNAADSHVSRRKVGSTMAQRSSRAATDREQALDTGSGEKRSKVIISQPGRLGRVVQLPERFR